MSEARDRSEWARMSSLLSLLANAHRDPKKTGKLTPADFNPYTAKHQDQRIDSDITALKAVFVDRRLPIELLESSAKGDQG